MTRPRIHINPRDDARFDALVARAVSRTRDVGTAERLLRRDFPRTAIHVSEVVGSPTVSWYVYREGGWVRDGA